MFWYLGAVVSSFLYLLYDSIVENLSFLWETEMLLVGSVLQMENFLQNFPYSKTNWKSVKPECCLSSSELIN